MLLHSTFAYNELLRMYGNDKKGIATQGSLTNTSLNSTFLSANDAISHKISGPLLVATTVSSTIVSPQKKTEGERNQPMSSEETIWGAINLNLIATPLLLQTVFGHLLITEIIILATALFQVSFSYEMKWQKKQSSFLASVMYLYIT